MTLISELFGQATKPSKSERVVSLLRMLLELIEDKKEGANPMEEPEIRVRPRVEPLGGS